MIFYTEIPILGLDCCAILENPERLVAALRSRTCNHAGNLENVGRITSTMQGNYQESGTANKGTKKRQIWRFFV